jgi:hypothetical protein
MPDAEVDDAGVKSAYFHRITKCDANTILGVVIAGVNVGQVPDSTVVLLTSSLYVSARIGSSSH